MAASQPRRAMDRHDRTDIVHETCYSFGGLLAAVFGRMAVGHSDHSHSEQFCAGTYTQSLRDRSGYMGLSTVCNNLWSHGNGATPSDEELLTTVLSEDNHPGLLGRLLYAFGSIPQILLADMSELVRVTGSEIESKKLKAIFYMATRLAASSEDENEAFHNCSSLVRYLQVAMGKRRVETLRVLFLDTHNRLIADHMMGEGTINEVPIYPREILRRALDLDSSAIIVAHNHPSQIISPSASDIEATMQLIAAARNLDIVVHDHLIVSSSSFHSMRFHGTINPWN